MEIAIMTSQLVSEDRFHLGVSKLVTMDMKLCDRMLIG